MTIAHDIAALLDMTLIGLLFAIYGVCAVAGLASLWLMDDRDERSDWWEGDR
jgi:hypothetical protein